MAYADSIRVPNPPVSTIATLIDGLRVSYGKVIGTTLINTTSVTAVDMTGISVSVTVPSGGIVYVHTDIQFSHSTGSYCTFRLTEDGSQIGIDQCPMYSGASSSAGTSSTISFSDLRVAASAGAHTYKVQWYVGSGTGYSLRQHLFAVVFQNT